MKHTQVTCQIQGGDLASSYSSWFNDLVSPKTATTFVVQTLTLIVGVSISLYLLVQHTQLKSGIQESSSFCNISSFADCDVVNASEYSEVFGVPIAALGAIFYFAMLVLALLFPPRGNGFGWGQGWIARLALLGLGVDLYLFGIQIFALGNLCVMCVATYAVTLVVFLTAYLAVGKSRGNVAAYLKSLWQPRTQDAPTLVFPHFLLGVLALVAFGTVLFLTPLALKMRSQSYEMVNRAMSQYFERWKELPAHPITVSPGDGTYGNPAAKVQIVEFSDFECPHCQRAAFTMHTAKGRLKDKAFFVFKHFPLDPSCNTSVKAMIHPNACVLARLSYCANQKKAFWPYHDAVFFKFDQEKHIGSSPVLDSVKEGALKSYFTEAEYHQCLASPESLAAVQEDIKLANARSVDGTPAVFVNGKRVTIPVTLENLEKLIEIESKL